MTTPQGKPLGLGAVGRSFASAEALHDAFLDTDDGDPSHTEVVIAHVQAWELLDEVMVSATRTLVDVAPWIHRSVILGWVEAFTSLLDIRLYGDWLRLIAASALAVARRVAARFRDDVPAVRVGIEVAIAELLAVQGRFAEARGYVEGVAAAFPGAAVYWSAARIYSWQGVEQGTTELLRARELLLEGLAFGDELDSLFGARLREVNRWLGARIRQAG